MPPENNMPDQAVIMMKDFLIAYKDDSKEQQKVLKETRDCLQAFKLDYAGLKAKLNLLLDSCAARHDTCSIKHNDFEQRLRTGPSSEGINSIKNTLEKMEKKLEDIPSPDIIDEMQEDIEDNRKTTNKIQLRIAYFMGGAVVLMFLLEKIWPSVSKKIGLG